MWLPRLRFTLVPHSSRNQFWRIFFSFSFVRLGVFCKFFCTKVQLHLCFTQAQEGAKDGGIMDWVGLEGPWSPSSATPAMAGSPPWGTEPFASGSPAGVTNRGHFHHAGWPGHPKGQGASSPPPGTFPRSHKCLGPSPPNNPSPSSGSAWLRQSLICPLGFLFFLTLHKCSFWVEFVAWTLR